MSKQNKSTLQACIVIGRGFISRDELAALQAGQCFITRQNCGEDFSFRVADNDLAYGRIWVIDGFFGFQFRQLVSGVVQNGHGIPTTSLTDVLPISVELCSCTLDIDELSGIGIDSILLTDKAFQDQEDVVLRILGQDIAVGKTIVYQQFMGIRITKVFMNLPLTQETSQNIESGFRINTSFPGGEIKDYDFRRPDHVTWDFVKWMELVHTPLSRQLSRILTLKPDSLDVLVDQMTLDEYRAGFRDQEYSHFPLDFQFSTPPSTPRLVPGHKLILESRHIHNQANEKLKERLSQKLIEQRAISGKVLYSIRKSAQSPAIDKGLIPALLKEMWMPLFPVNSAPSPSTGTDFLPGSQMIILVSFVIEGQAHLNLVYPLTALTPVMKRSR